MSAEIVVGNTHIPYFVRESVKAKKLTIHVTPDEVEVVVPPGTDQIVIDRHLKVRRRWVYEKRDELLDKLRMIQGVYPENYLTGSKIMFRGRMLRITVRGVAGIDEPAITYRTGFYIDVPNTLPFNEKTKIVKIAIESWMKKLVLKDCKSLLNRYSEKLSLYPKGIRIKEQKNLWGSCGKDKIININWHLIHAPYKILEYVVVHEMVHLKYRNHTEEFWTLLRSTFRESDYCDEWLGKYQITV
jgi:predicted metal-dependent hydrolase